MSRKPVSSARRKEIGARLAAGRAAAKAKRDETMARVASAPPPTGHNNPPPDQPAFMRDAPQPEARAQQAPPPSNDDKARERMDAVGQIVMMYAGAHFMFANATGIPQLVVSKEEAEAVANSFVTMMDKWGYDVSSVMGGKIGATITFGFTFGMIELQKVRLFNAVMAQRAQEARERSRQPQPDTPQAANNMPEGVGPDAMADPFAQMREAAD